MTARISLAPTKVRTESMSIGTFPMPAFLVHDIHAEINIEYAKIARPPVHRRGIGPLTSVAGSIRRHRRLDRKAERGESHSPRGHPPADRDRAEGEEMSDKRMGPIRLIPIRLIQPWRCTTPPGWREYAAMMRAGDEFPPVQVIRQSSKLHG